PFLKRDLAPAERPLHIQEQRRLFYVALTRAREVLVVSSAANVPRAVANKELNGVVLKGGNAQSGRTIPCEFISELGSQAPATQLGTTWAADGFQ
ncbi:MAG: 3'-5' exonuclease, partial [Gammaproteobacteria bacterium]